MSVRIRQHPRRWFWSGVGVALLVGLVLGAAGNDKRDEVKTANSRADSAEARLASTQTELASATQEQEQTAADLATARERIKKLTARADVPSFVGDDASSVDANDIVQQLGWRIRIVDRPSSKAEGTVLAQQPGAGTSLERGQTVTVVSAVPRPKQWTTARSFSGSGSTKTNEFRIPSDVKVRVKYVFNGDTNAILTLETPGDSLGSDLILNEIGDQAATSRIYDAAGVHYFDIEGGTWTVELQYFK